METFPSLGRQIKGGITAVDHTGAGNGTSNYFKRSFLRKQVFENNK